MARNGAVYFKIQTINPFHIEMGDLSSVKDYGRGTVHPVQLVHGNCVKCVLGSRTVDNMS